MESYRAARMNQLTVKKCIQRLYHVGFFTFLRKHVPNYTFSPQGSSHYDNYLLKPKSLDNSESKLQRKFICVHSAHISCFFFWMKMYEYYHSDVSRKRKENSGCSCFIFILLGLTGQESEPSPVFSSEIRCKSNTILGLCPSKSHAQLSLLYNSELSRRNSGTLFYVWSVKQKNNQTPLYLIHAHPARMNLSVWYTYIYISLHNDVWVTLQFLPHY